MMPLVILLISWLGHGAQRAQARTDYWFAHIGVDTVEIERISRTRTRIEGDLATRVPRTQILHYVAELDGDGRITRFTRDSRLPDGTVRPGSAVSVMDIGGDSIRITVTRGVSVVRSAAAASRDVTPLLHPFYSYALLAHAIERAVAAGGDSMAIEFLLPGMRASLRHPVLRVGADSISLPNWAGGDVRGRIDGTGRVVVLHGLETTFKIEAARVDSLPFDALARDFAARDAAGRGLGTLSPRDTVRADLGAARLWIDYSRPHIRGRIIFGQLVPYGQVWRTGADAATQLETSAPIVIGGARIPAGRYSLWTVPRLQGAELIVNAQTGQWGTQYDSTKDVVHVPLTASDLKTPVDPFTVRFETRGAGVVLRLEWERTAYEVSITP